MCVQLTRVVKIVLVSEPTVASYGDIEKLFLCSEFALLDRVVKERQWSDAPLKREYLKLKSKYRLGCSK
jgi:hypothetical protein